jgi:hypothetical protein
MTQSLKCGARLVLVLYLIATLLTGCSTVGVRVEDPTEPIRLDAPLIDRSQLLVDVPVATFTPGPFYAYARYDPPKYGQSLETALSQALTTSNAVQTVSAKESIAKGDSAIRVRASFDGTVPTYKWVGRIAYGVFSAFLLFIPMMFYSETNEAKLGADVVVIGQSGKEYGPVRVHTALEFDLGAAKVGADTWPTLMALGVEDLSRKIVLELKRHPHWFEVAR